ncbi:MAG TPA: hypothetical protein DCF49_04055 [Lachnospiraceae bacterium]|nr:hypothetical protein [Lachnospiraceae bacterium]
MVNNNRKQTAAAAGSSSPRRLARILLASGMLFVLGLSFGIPASAAGPVPSPSAKTAERHDILALPTEEEEEVLRMVGPDLPPAGMRYDEWKGFQYSDEVSFDARTYWTILMGKDKVASDYGLVQDPEHVEDGKITFVDAFSEPVGGEMKLRHGGYVDITIEIRWTGTLSMTGDDTYYMRGVEWQETPVLPCDAYTGTSLLNYQGDPEDQDIYQGQAVNSGMVESDVSIGGRTYRLFAKSDIRNSSFSDYTFDLEADPVRMNFPASVDTTLTLRVPADYDGMILAIDKDITDEKPSERNSRGEFAVPPDQYADILTTGTGRKQTAEDFYFVRVSDLLEKFKR